MPFVRNSKGKIVGVRPVCVGEPRRRRDRKPRFRGNYDRHMLRNLVLMPWARELRQAGKPPHQIKREIVRRLGALAHDMRAVQAGKPLPYLRERLARHVLNALGDGAVEAVEREDQTLEGRSAESWRRARLAEAST